MRKTLLATICLFMIPLPLEFAFAEETSVLVRALSREAKLIGDAVGGARITVENAETGALLASGTTAGSTGDTRAIMRDRRGSSTAVFDSPGAAAFEARFDLEEPTLVRFTAEGPLAYPQARALASKTLLLEPGTTIAGGGLVLELHGYIVELAQARMTDEGLAVLAKVRMLCSCPTEPGGLWTAGEVRAIVSDETGEVGAADLTYAGAASNYAGLVALSEPGRYKLKLVASSPEHENFGHFEATIELLEDRSVTVVSKEGS